MVTRLVATTTAVNQLSDAQRTEMWTLYSQCYSGTSRHQFEEDLAEKQDALLVEDAGGTIQGFSTIRTWMTAFQGGSVQIVFSGDTILHPLHWGSQALAFEWLRYAGNLKRLKPSMPLYWFLIVKGPRTYRYLSAFALRFFPHWNQSELKLQELAGKLARERYAEYYDVAAGRIRYPQSHGHLTPQLARVSAREASRDDVRYFLKRNPQYERGEELVCICELSENNLKPLARRAFLRAHPS